MNNLVMNNLVMGMLMSDLANAALCAHSAWGSDPFYGAEDEELPCALQEDLDLYRCEGGTPLVLDWAIGELMANTDYRDSREYEKLRKAEWSARGDDGDEELLPF